MNCRLFEDRLEEFLEARSSDMERKAFLQHEQLCPRCHEQLEDARFAREVTRTAFPQEEWTVPPYFFSHLWQAIDADRVDGFSWSGLRDLALRFSAGVALIMTILIGVNIFSSSRSSETQAAIENYLDAPGASDSLRDILIGDLKVNRDELLQNLLQRDRVQPGPVHAPRENPRLVSSDDKKQKH